VVVELRWLPEALGGVAKEPKPIEQLVEAVANLVSFFVRRGEEQKIVNVR
jgi:hypothetical protein